VGKTRRGWLGGGGVCRRGGGGEGEEGREGEIRCSKEEEKGRWEVWFGVEE